MTDARASTAEYPTMAQQAAVAWEWAAHMGRAPAGEIGRRVGLPAGTVLAIRRWQIRKGYNADLTPWLGERLVKPGKVVRCPTCRAKLTVYIPGRPCRACRMRGERGA